MAQPLLLQIQQIITNKSHALMNITSIITEKTRHITGEKIHFFIQEDALAIR